MNLGKVRSVGYRLSTILPTLFICLFACANTNPKITKTLLKQKFAQIFEANAEATYTMHESFIADLTGDGINEGVVNYGAESNNGGNWGDQARRSFTRIMENCTILMSFFPILVLVRGKVPGLAKSQGYRMASSMLPPSVMRKTTRFVVHRSKQNTSLNWWEKNW